MSILSTHVLGNSLLTWLIALSVALVSFTILRVLRGFLSRRLSALAASTSARPVEMMVGLIGRTRSYFLLILALYAGSLLLTLSATAMRVIDKIVILALLLQIGLWVTDLLGRWLEHYREDRLETDPNSVTTLYTIGFLGRFVLWSVLLLLALANVGIDITALIAGLGIGGIAVALAVQSILSDLFASLSITLDKPFVIGDFLTVGEYQGTVERIGLKTTRVRSLSGEQIVFSNADLLNSRVRNYKRMLERRAVFTLRVRYETPAEKLEAIPAMIQGIVESSGPTRFDRSHFKEYGEYGLVYETVYYMLVPDYNEYMDTQQKINLAVYRAFDAAGISFALPTQRLFLQEGVRPSAGPREGDMPVETH